jgi:hypothetical protein
MLFVKKISEKYCLETQLRMMPKQLSISFDVHYSDGSFCDHQGVYFSVMVLGLFFEFNIYNMSHEDEDETI